MSAVVFVAEAALVVAAILCVALSLHDVSLKGRDWTSQVTVTLNVPGTLDVIAIVANTIALFLNMLTSHFKWSEQTGEHLHLLASYQLIAQRARRVDASAMVETEIFNLCRQLEETFEIYKTTGREPSNRQFQEAQKLMKEMRSYPFGITADSL